MKFQEKEIITFVLQTTCIDSVLRTEKKYNPQVYLEQCKYKIKKRELVNFISE